MHAETIILNQFLDFLKNSKPIFGNSYQMIKSIILTAFCILFLSQIQAQEYTFGGVIKNTQSQEPIPFAHCKIVNSNTGFVTDRNGRFSYQSTQKQLTISITAIGYKVNTITISHNEVQAIELEPDTQTLSEVVVTYVDRERELLQKVLNNLKQNYPQTTERLKGTIVEQLAKDSLYQDLIYTATSAVEADKLTYTNKNVYSTVKVSDGEVEYFQSIDSSFTKIYAGAHNVHRFDIMAARIPPFDNIKTKSYEFDLIDTLVFDDKALFKMHFKASKYSGFLYIQDSTFALIKGEYIVRNEKLNTLALRSKRLFLHFTTEYFKEKEKFRIGYINYQTGFSKSKRADEKVYLNNFFYLNEFDNATKPIGYNEQTNFTDILIEELPIKETEIATEVEEKKKGKKLFQILRNLTASQGIGLLRCMSQTSSNELIGSGINEHVNHLIFSSSVGYTLSNILEIEYANATSFKRKQLSVHSFLLRYKQPFTKNQRWKLGISGGINFTDMNLNLEDIETQGKVWEGQRFESRMATLKEKSEQINLISELQLSYRIGARMHLVANGFLPFSWRNKTIVTLQQNETTAQIFNAKSHRSMSINYYQIGLGLYIGM